MQTIHFNPDGTVRQLVATGLAANVQGGEPFKDVGRVLWLPGTNEIVFSAGPHPVCEAIEFGNFLTGLGAFCHALSRRRQTGAARPIASRRGHVRRAPALVEPPRACPLLDRLAAVAPLGRPSV